MNHRTIALIVGALVFAPSVVAIGLPELGRIVLTRVYDDNGELMLEQGIEAGTPGLLYTEHYLRVGALDGKPGGGADPGTDCESDSYRVAGWFWTKPWSAKSSDYASIMSGASNKWDQHAGGASIAGGVTSGNDGTAGVQDFKNNIQFVNLGGGSTVAVTTTWSYRGSGEAVESDARYNTAYPWSTSGASNAMDVDSVATHEIGHTFGLNHPSGSGIECLTMYAYVNYGWTHGRTLGDGDILGIKAVYG